MNLCIIILFSKVLSSDSHELSESATVKDMRKERRKKEMILHLTLVSEIYKLSVSIKV
jgi:hypothetical protein